MNKIYLIVHNERLEIKFITFSDGAENCVIPEFEGDRATIVASVENCAVDIIRILLIKEALDNLLVKRVMLVMPYIPNARCDRRFNKQESFPLKVFSKLINDCNFESVNVCDPHSEVSAALIDRIQVTTQQQAFSTVENFINLNIGNDYVVCAPDAGASKKAGILAHKVGKRMVQASKNRNLSTGQIINTTVPETPFLVGADVLIVDDICDGGATFKFLADELFKQGVKSVSLYVTHGIFAKGLEPLNTLSKIFVVELNECYVNRRDIQLFNERLNEQF